LLRPLAEAEGLAPWSGDWGQSSVHPLFTPDFVKYHVASRSMSHEMPRQGFFVSIRLQRTVGRIEMSTQLRGTVAFSILLVSASASLADPGENFGGNGGAWNNDFGNHYVNEKNPDLRQDWDTGRRAIPGGAAQVQEDNPTTNDSEHNVISRPDSTLVDPHHTLP